MDRKFQINTKGVLPEIIETVSSFCDTFIFVHGKNLLSVALYGSALTQDYMPGVSNINLVTVFSEIKFSTLGISLKTISGHKKKFVVAPLFLTLDFIKNSTKEFPIEFLEIKENHKTLYGKEVFDDLEIPDNHIFMHCQQQLKSQVVRLRQFYLENGANKKMMKFLLTESMASILPVLKNVLRLYGEKGESYQDTVIKINAHNLFDGQIFIDILFDRNDVQKVVWNDSEMLYQEYLNQLDFLSTNLDTMFLKGKQW